MEFESELECTISGLGRVGAVEVLPLVLLTEVEDFGSSNFGVVFALVTGVDLGCDCEPVALFADEVEVEEEEEEEVDFDL